MHPAFSVIFFTVASGAGFGLFSLMYIADTFKLGGGFSPEQLVIGGLVALGLIVFGLGWGFFDCNNMPILCQVVRPTQRATGYGVMNMVSISGGGFADWGFGAMRDARVPLDAIFGVFSGVAVVSVVLVLLIRPRSSC